MKVATPSPRAWIAHITNESDAPCRNCRYIGSVLRGAKRQEALAQHLAFEASVEWDAPAMAHPYIRNVVVNAGRRLTITVDVGFHVNAALIEHANELPWLADMHEEDEEDGDMLAVAAEGAAQVNAYINAFAPYEEDVIGHMHDAILHALPCSHGALGDVSQCFDARFNFIPEVTAEDVLRYYDGLHY